MSRRAFNLAEFANGLLKDMAFIQQEEAVIQRCLREIEVKLQVAAKMAEPKSKKEVKADGDNDPKQ